MVFGLGPSGEVPKEKTCGPGFELVNGKCVKIKEKKEVQEKDIFKASRMEEQIMKKKGLAELPTERPAALEAARKDDAEVTGPSFHVRKKEGLLVKKPYVVTVGEKTLELTEEEYESFRKGSGITEEVRGLTAERERIGRVKAGEELSTEALAEQEALAGQVGKVGELPEIPQVRLSQADVILGRANAFEFVESNYPEITSQLSEEHKAQLKQIDTIVNVLQLKFLTKSTAGKRLLRRVPWAGGFLYELAGDPPAQNQNIRTTKNYLSENLDLIGGVIGDVSKGSYDGNFDNAVSDYNKWKAGVYAAEANLKQHSTEDLNVFNEMMGEIPGEMNTLMDVEMWRTEVMPRLEDDLARAIEQRRLRLVQQSL